MSREQLRIAVSALFGLIISAAFESGFEMDVRLVFNTPFELKIRMCSAINTNASLISHNITFGATQFGATYYSEWLTFGASQFGAGSDLLKGSTTIHGRTINSVYKYALLQLDVVLTRRRYNWRHYNLTLLELDAVTTERC